ncbi:metabotropic glutamate receptor 2 isoform X1 [Tribolium madens]|uniref:metabotropic glutamate receptor 2 isoform X1 n=1 Tax=Tribolium madens TaxID=41895 RepID=UPI001CF764AB|nr:metabotropic glutamate receptor 2 isoform X1 [Tribolium madens]XP_044265977.1 metabotropic glutamate receptor 2 isoform X1 [Tribolium madens]XP_044265985.1 metabotropic glutamate receptor 2 isoform X1 [Tribolium madens]
MLSLLLVTLAIASLATNLDMKTNFVNYTIPETEKIIGLSGVTSIQGETDDIRNKSIERDKAEGNSPFPECRGQQLCDNLLNISTSTLTPNVANMSEKVIIETQIPATFRKFNISERTGIGDNLITSSDNLVKENSKKFKLNARKVGERSTKKTPQTNHHKSFQSDDIFRRKIRGEGNMNSVSTMIVLGKNQRQSRTTKVLSQNQSITTEGSTVETMKVSTTTTHKYTSPLRSDYPFESIVLSGKNPSDSSDFSGSSLRPTWDTTPPKPVAVSNSVGKTRNFIKVSTITSHSTESVTPATKKEAKTFGVVKYANKFSQSPFANLKIHMETPTHRSLLNLLTTEGNLVDLETGTKSVTDDLTTSSGNFSDGVSKVIQQQEIPWPVKKEAVVEGDLVLGGLMMVHEREDTITCGPVMPQGGIQALEAMLYTLDRLNFGSESILPNITLGAHILDDCDKDTYGLEMAVDFIKGSISNIDGAEYHCNKTQVRKVISGVVGAASSVTSIQVANLLRLFKIPQVSFFSTSPELSNKQRFEFFTRTIPSDHYQVKAMVNIVILMGWSYISIIYEESNYGIKAFEELEDLLAEHNICIAVKEKLVKDSGVADESAYDNIVQKLLTKPRARGCIIFGSDQEVAGVMRAVRRSNATGSFSWIGSDGWSARSLVSDGNEAEVEGTLSVQPQANPVRGFEEYFLSLNVENNSRNPWFIEFWEHHFQCRYPNSSKTPYNQKHSHLCTGKEKLTRQNTVFEDQLQFVSDAVMAFAYAIRDMHRDLCHGRPGLCDAMKPTKGTELLKYLRKVDFEGLSGDRFHFDSNGDGPARYNIIHFKQVSKGKYQWVRVGEYVEGELRLNMSEIQFKLGHPKPPESVCSFPCDLGQAKKYVEGESCCWHCFNCTQYQILHPKDPTQCIACPQGTVPDPHHIRCEDIPEEYLRPDSGWAIGAMAFSSTGILITMFVCGVFIRHNDTPVVRASGRELSYVLLAGILMCFSVTYALVLRPNDVVCGIQRFGAGFCFTVVYAALLTKTNRISRIFNAGKHSAKRPSFISPRSQLIICSGLVGVQVLINGVWMVISPARAIHHYPTREDNLLVCSSYIDASYMIAFTYPIFLIVICTVYAVLTRKIPEAFNESKHIGFTMYTTCVIWLAFVPLYFGTANHVALRITSMSVTISLSASVTVACLFSPKLYIILIRPERNVRQSMMPMRYSAINKSSATTGSGSMMAAVMVTAATCDQKQQIQKHVPPVEKDEDLSESKVKPETKDISTQTSPAISNNMLNSSQEHLPKINNNCNVGNGPIGILPCVQTKDFPL